MMLRRKIPLSLVGNDMHHDRLADVLRLFDGCPHGICVHPVNGAQIRDAQILEQHTGKEDGFDLILGSADLLHNLRILVAQGIVHLIAKIQIRIRGADSLQILGHSSHVLGNRTVIVVENDDKIRIQPGRIVQAFIGKTSCQRTVSDHGYHRIMLSSKISCLDIAKPRRDGRGRMTCVKSIAVALSSSGKASHASKLAQRIKARLASCQNFMRVGLMSHVPDNLIFRKIQGQMKPHRQFYGSKVTRKMASRHTDLFDQKLPDFFRKLRICLLRNLFDISRMIDLIQIIAHDIPFYFVLVIRCSTRFFRNSFSSERPSMAESACPVSSRTFSAAVSSPFMETYVAFPSRASFPMLFPSSF